MKNTFLTLTFSLAAALPAAPQIVDERLPPLIEAAVPANIGSPDLVNRLLSPPASPRISLRFDERAVEQAVDDNLPPDTHCKKTERCILKNDRGSALRIDLPRGRVRYSSRERSTNKQPTTVSADRSLVIARAAAEAFGIPAFELGAPDFSRLRLTTASPVLPDAASVSYLTEGHVRFRRRIGGFLVVSSKFFTAVDARGQVARAYARWPDFALEEGLRAEQALTRSQVVRAVYQELSWRLRVGTTQKLVGQVAYAPVNYLDQTEGEDEMGTPPGSGAADPVRTVAFVPVLLITVIPVAQPDNSGVTQMPVQDVLIPLFQGPAVDAPAMEQGGLP
jgi:hypothetical protein